MTMKLYFAPGACSFVPHTLLETIGEPFEAQMVKLHKGEQNAPEYRAINPRGQVPVLVDGDAVITQIVAIVDYLDRKFPQHGFLPTGPLERAKALETLAWMNNTVHPTFTHVFMPFKYSDKPEVQAELKAYNAQQRERIGVDRAELRARSCRAPLVPRPHGQRLDVGQHGPIQLRVVSLQLGLHLGLVAVL